MELLKASRRLLFTLFIINQYFMPKMFYYKNVSSKQVGGYFIVYSSLIKRLMFFYEKCEFQASGRQRFSLFIISQYCTTKMLSLQILENFLEGCY